MIVSLFCTLLRWLRIKNIMTNLSCIKLKCKYSSARIDLKDQQNLNHLWLEVSLNIWQRTGAIRLLSDLINAALHPRPAAKESGTRSQ
jgi:hypothetical protein